MPIAREKLLADLPPEWPEPLLPQIQAQIRLYNTKVVVLDDDPTGNQTVHDVAVLTEGSEAALTQAFREPDAVVYVLTNSRSLPAAAAQALNREIATNLKAARAATDRDFVVVSRSDSTLRGHYPAEVDALMDVLDRRVHATLIVPFFIEGGRLTVGDVHYVAEGDMLIPAAQTEYAKDAVFGYRHSNLRAWVSEKHGGRIAPEDVASLTLEDIRTGGPEAVGAKLVSLPPHSVCVVNAAGYRDLEVVVAGLLNAEASGRHYIYRTAASFVRVRGGIAPRPLLTAEELAAAAGEAPATGGLVIAGSHVQKSTRQIAAAAARPDVSSVAVAVPALVRDATRQGEIARVTAEVNRTLRRGEDALVYTSREVLTDTETLDSLEIGRRVSQALVDIVAGLTVRPAWMIAKGGITASDVATDALDVKRAEVLGQAIPGVPIWQTGAESRWPGLLYVVFPGNVGTEEDLARMIELLQRP